MTRDALKRSLVTAERGGHGDVVVEARAITSAGHAAEHGARVVSPVERYSRRGQLSLRQVRAAELIYRAWAIMNGARPESGGCSAWTPAGWSDAQIAATRSYEAAQRAVGQRIWPLLFHIACLDWTCERFANERGRNSTSTLEVLRYGLDTVADVLGIPE